MIFNRKTRTTLAVGLIAGCAALMAPGLAAHAQNLAAAAPSESSSVAKPRPGRLVFFEQNSTELSPTANKTIRQAADAARTNKAKVIRIVGRNDVAQAVKSALVLEGVLPTQIAMVGRDDSPIVRSSSGAETVSRSVLIAF